MIGGIAAYLARFVPSASAYRGLNPQVDVRTPAALSTQGRTKVVNAVHSMHAMHSVSIPRSVGCSRGEVDRS